MAAVAPKTRESDSLLAFCKASADQLRLDILRVLRDESFGVLELCQIFDTAQPGMSHHLKILANGGLVATRREGNSIFYRRAMTPDNTELAELMQALFASIDQMPLRDEVSERCRSIHTDRAERSRQFFEKNADRLKENQSLIAEFSHYSGCVLDLMQNENIDRDARVLEIGPGESELLQLLTGHFNRITALDNSAEMLGKARATIAESTNTAVDFVHGEPGELDAGAFDLVILNMVLHHLPSPAAFFREADRLLARDGRLMIMDLRPHDQDWTRDICGDIWLGFEPDDLDKWAGDAGLTRGQSVYLGLKNGFQVQVRLFHKHS